MLQSYVKVNSVTKKVFSAEKPCYRLKAFLAQDNWFIFEGKLKMKVNKSTNLYL